MYIGRVFWALVVQEVVKTIVPHPVYLEQAEKHNFMGAIPAE